MKNRSLVLIASICLGILFILSVADAQPVFNFDTAGPGGYVNETGSGASGSIDFTDPDSIQVEITHTTSSPFDSSVISGIYFLKPSAVDSFFGSTRLLDAAFSSGPANWDEDKNGFGNVLNVFDTSLSDDLFFSAAVKNKTSETGIQQGATAQFTFDLDDLKIGEAFDWDAYLASDIPQVFVRFKSMLSEELGLTEENEGSAKGYAFFRTPGNDDPPVNPVPEPRTIGLLGFAAMAVLLGLRSRLKARAVSSKS